MDFLKSLLVLQNMLLFLKKFKYTIEIILIIITLT